MGKNKVTVILKTGRFDKFCTDLLTLLMMTAESMLSKRPNLGITETLFFLLTLRFFACLLCSQIRLIYHFFFELPCSVNIIKFHQLRLIVQ